MPTMHMHVGSVNVLEGSLQYDDFRDLIASRVHLVPSFRQRLVTVPFGLGRPVWVDDPELISTFICSTSRCLHLAAGLNCAI